MQDRVGNAVACFFAVSAVLYWIQSLSPYVLVACCRPIHTQQSMVIVPRDAPGVEILRPLGVFGHEHDHAEIIFNDVRVRVSGGLTCRAFLSSSSSRARLEPLLEPLL